jgi:hypothetical protein
VLPLASSSGPAFIAVVVIAAALLLWWLLRGETRDEQAAKAEREATREAELQNVGNATQETALTATHDADESRLSAP